MVKYNDLNDVFSSLSDSTRRDIIQDLLVSDKSVGELYKRFEGKMSLPAVSKHLKVLESAGLVSRKRKGREHIFRIQPKKLLTARDYIDKYMSFWTSRLDNLEKFLKGGE
jgi:DNA-binding transcriptional ArsR family regulator